MESSYINLFVSTFAGLRLPRTISLQVPSSYSVNQCLSCIEDRLPNLESRIIITTTSRLQKLSLLSAPITSLLSSSKENFINLRLSAPICGGKGGFGSQLRAAGGRMSSRKKKNRQDANGSSRNLDGRRLRTIKEAKALAEYLAVKPDMDKKRQEEARKRWEKVVESAEQKQEELRHGGKARLNGKWMEAKDEALEKTHEAVLNAVSAGRIHAVFVNSVAISDGSETSDDSDNQKPDAKPALRIPAQAESSQAQARNFFGWEEEDLSESSDENEDEDADVKTGKAVLESHSSPFASSLGH